LSRIFFKNLAGLPKHTQKKAWWDQGSFFNFLILKIWRIRKSSRVYSRNLIKKSKSGWDQSPNKEETNRSSNLEVLWISTKYKNMYREPCFQIFQLINFLQWPLPRYDMVLVYVALRNCVEIELGLFKQFSLKLMEEKV